MDELHLSVAVAAYDRTVPLRDGRVRIEGCTHTFLEVGHEALFLRGFHNAEYDVCELSFSTYMTSVSRGDGAYLAIPVFPSRLFRHSAIYLNAGAGIRRASQLAGKRVGVPEYQMTAALWVRGLLEDDYGVPPSAMKWRQGGLHQAGRREKLTLDLGGRIELSAIPEDRTLDALLRIGEIDALISARPPRSFLEGDAGVVRLFPNYRVEEEAYYASTGIFPIMHVIGIRKTLLDQHTWLANAVFDAFVQAKALAIADFSDLSALRVSLPWFAPELERTRALMGSDFWPYGFAANRTTIEQALGYAHRHGTIKHPMQPEALFASTTLENALI